MDQTAEGLVAATERKHSIGETTTAAECVIDWGDAIDWLYAFRKEDLRRAVQAVTRGVATDDEPRMLEVPILKHLRGDA